MLQLLTLNLHGDVRETNTRGKMQNAECKTRNAGGGLGQRRRGGNWLHRHEEGRRGFFFLVGRVEMGGLETCGMRQIRPIGNQDEPL